MSSRITSKKHADSISDIAQEVHHRGFAVVREILPAHVLEAVRQVVNLVGYTLW